LNTKVEHIVEQGKEDGNASAQTDHYQAIVDSLLFGWPGDFAHFSIGAGQVVFDSFNHIFS